MNSFPSRSVLVAGDGGGGVGGVAASTLADSTRVRYDPTRRVGNANAVALKRAVAFTVISEAELQRMYALVNGPVCAEGQLFGASSSSVGEGSLTDGVTGTRLRQRQALSRAREASWPDSIHSKRERLAEQRRQAEEDRLRRRDQIEAELLEWEELQRQEKAAVLAEKQLEDDPRGRRLQNLLELEDLKKEWEEQMQWKQLKAEEEARQLQAEKGAMDQLVVKVAMEKREAAQARRVRNVEEKNHHLTDMWFQLQQRRERKRGGVEERQQAERDAQNAEEEEREEEAERREAAAKCEAHNKLFAKPRTLLRVQVKQKAVATAEEEAARLAHEQKINEMRQAANDRAAAKRERFERRKEKGLSVYAEKVAVQSPVRRTQDRFTGAEGGLFESIFTGNASRVSQQRAARERATQEQLAATSAYAGPNTATHFLIRERKPRCDSTGHPTAAADKYGFLSKAEADEYAASMRTLQQSTDALRQEENQRVREAEERRMEILRLQALEKATQRQMEREAELTAARQRSLALEQEEQQLREHFMRQLPAGADPSIVDKAMRV